MIKIITYNNNYKEQTIKLLLSILEDELGYKKLERPDVHDIPSVYQKDSMGNFWLAIDNNEVIGTIALQNYGNKRGMIKRMCVKKEYRRKSIGQKLLNSLLKFAKNSGHKTVYSTTMYEFTAAKNLYRKNSFVEIKKLPEDLAMPGEDIFLELKL